MNKKEKVAQKLYLEHRRFGGSHSKAIELVKQKVYN